MKQAKFLYFFDFRPRSWDIAIFWSASNHVNYKERLIWVNSHNSAPRPKIKKVKAFCFLQLLKFKKAKCLYFFPFWPRSWDIAIFWFSCNHVNYKEQLIWEKGHNSAPRPKIKKVKALCFLQLLKLEKAKCLYFFWFMAQELRYSVFLISSWAIHL